MIIETILASLVPVGVEGIKQGLSHLFGGVKALTIEDQIKLDNNEIERMKALAVLDQPGGTPSQWVVDLRASSRYIGAWACIALGSYMVMAVPPIDAGAELIGVAFGFLFGSRLVNLVKK